MSIILWCVSETYPEASRAQLLAVALRLHICRHVSDQGESLCHQKVAQMCLAVKEVGMSWFLMEFQKRSTNTVVGRLLGKIRDLWGSSGHKVKSCSLGPQFICSVDSASDGDRRRTAGGFKKF